MAFIFISLGVVFLVILATSIFQMLWNMTMPQVCNLRQISFWVAFRLLMISGFLTSGSFIHFNWNH